jgi:hypothetical protein
MRRAQNYVALDSQSDTLSAAPETPLGAFVWMELTAGV